MEDGTCEYARTTFRSPVFRPWASDRAIRIRSQARTLRVICGCLPATRIASRHASGEVFGETPNIATEDGRAPQYVKELKRHGSNRFRGDFPVAATMADAGDCNINHAGSLADEWENPKVLTNSKINGGFVKIFEKS